MNIPMIVVAILAVLVAVNEIVLFVLVARFKEKERHYFHNHAWQLYGTVGSENDWMPPVIRVRALVVSGLPKRIKPERHTGRVVKARYDDEFGYVWNLFTEAEILFPPRWRQEKILRWLGRMLPSYSWDYRDGVFVGRKDG